MNFVELIALVHHKNELNRRRRRFMNVARYTYGKALPKHITLAEAVRGLEKTREESKAVTKILRVARKELSAEFRWGKSGNIKAVSFDNGRFVNARHFKAYHQDYIVDKILLG